MCSELLADVLINREIGSTVNHFTSQFHLITCQYQKTSLSGALNSLARL